jgi:parallel beta-helix repeat protein
VYDTTLTTLCIWNGTAWEFISDSGDTTVNVKDFGAKGDGVTDDQTAIQNASNYATANNRSLYFPDGTYLHSSTLTFTSIAVYGTGGATVVATDTTSPDPNHALILSGTNASISGLKVTTNWTGARQQNYAAAGIFVLNCTNFSITQCTVTNSAQIGILMSTSSYGRVYSNYVQGTLADGIHHVEGANNVVTSNNVLRATGDDSISVVGYTSGLQPYDILIVGNKSYLSSGRGITCIGGKQVTIEANQIERSSGAGISASSELTYNTYASSKVSIVGNQLIDCNTNPATVNGCIFSSGYVGFVNTDIQIIGNHITSTGAVVLVGLGGISVQQYTAAPVIKDNIIVGMPAKGIWLNCSDADVFSNTVKSSAQDGIAGGATTSGRYRISENRIEDSATAGIANRGHINFEASAALTKAFITSNTLINGGLSPTGIRFIPAREILVNTGNTIDSVNYPANTNIQKTGTDYFIDLTQSNQIVNSGAVSVQGLFLVPGETFSIKLFGKKTCPVRFNFSVVRYTDQNQWLLLNQYWRFLLAGPVGVAGVDYVALTGPTYYQRLDITNYSNGTFGTFAMTADASDNVTITFSPPAGVGVSLYCDFSFVYKSA